MAPKQRNKSNKRYPTNWRARKRGNRYYITFRCPQSARHLWGDKSEPTLGIGDTLHEAERKAHEAWAEKIHCSETPYTMGAAFDRYEAEVVPKKAPATQKSNLYSLRRLRSVIPADMPVTAFETHHAYAYQDQCARLESKKKANLDTEVLSHLFTKCLEWGTPRLKEHPIRGKMKKLSLPPRDRYIEDWELDALLSVSCPMLAAYIPLKHALGIDKCIMLRIQLRDIKEDCLSIPKRTKIKSNPKAKAKDYPFYSEGESTGLKELIDDVLAWRKKHVKVLSPHLFCTSLGRPYIQEDGTTEAFNSAWQRDMTKVLEETALTEKFTEHDICAKAASDIETLEQAAALRGHLNTSTTEKIYRRKPKKVIPLDTRRGGKKS